MTARRLKQIASVRISSVDKRTTERQRAVRLCNYTDVYYHERITSNLPFMEATATEEQIARFRIRAGDVLITKDSETADDIAVPAYVTEELHDVVCGYHLALLRPRPGIDGRYLFWALKSRSTKEQFSASANGITRFGLRYEAIGDNRIPVPAVQGQRLIADYLDRETARIDQVIAAKGQMITLLDERVESAIFAATTQGFPLATSYRNDRLPWAPTIPDCWSTPWVSVHFDVQLGKMLNAEAVDEPEQYSYLRNTDVRWGEISTADLPTMHFDSSERRRYSLQAGDLLVCEGGEVGRAAVWDGAMSECFYQKALHRLRARGDANPRFLMYVLRAMAKRRVFEVEGNTSTIVHLTAEQLRVRRFPWPPLSEQAEIVRQLDSLTGAARQVEKALADQIELLHERRQAVITAAVTGGLKAPEAAA